ncbi:hypothetical protein H5410_015477 [Solanum commersonii]|uniref:TTF-type domain-containing protein n=1 Tax=Solanum commersonii TaxID=4109 RepID=A0A9J5ZTL6_SOLCO|nr:hypothetical protein H5410_015477 [Solanum commersonii]
MVEVAWCGASPTSTKEKRGGGKDKGEERATGFGGKRLFEARARVSPVVFTDDGRSWKIGERVPKTILAPQNQNQLRRDKNLDQIEIPSHSSQRQEFDVNDLKFTQIDFFETPRRFVYTWFDEYCDWLEYTISADAAYCLPSYLFQGENINQGGGNVFSTKGFTNWHRKDSFATHMGPLNSVHNQSKRKYEVLMQEQHSIQAAFYKLNDKSKHEYRVRLNASIDVVRLLLNQGFAFCGHDESESSLKKDNFLEFLSWFAAQCVAIKPFVDVSLKEKMSICLRYVDKRGFVMEAFIGLVHIKDTSALSLKEAIVDVLANHSLALLMYVGNVIMGQAICKTLIRQESRLAHSVHCFAHQLRLTLVVVSKKCVQVGITNDLNVSLQKKEQDIANAMILIKIMRMDELYPDDFDGSNMRAFENQLANYIIDVRDIDKRFSNLSGPRELSKKFVETKKHLNYCLIFLLVKFVLLLPVATATVERAFWQCRLSRMTCGIEWMMNS